MLYWIIIIIEIADYIYGLILDVLNIKASKNPIPKILDGLYDKDRYAKQQAYFRINKRTSLLASLIDTLVQLALFAFGGYALFDGIVRSLTGSEILRTLLFFAIIGCIGWVVSLPFNIYGTFVIEERFGFNKVTPKLYVVDTLKELALSIVLGGGLLAIIVWIYTLTPQYFWLIAWAVTSMITLVVQYFYSTLLVPIFNKQKPLPAGELRDAIETFADKVGFKLKNIYVIDGSKRTTHSNAYFTGFGRNKRIVLYDTLMDQLTTDEIVGVLAHEIGHYKHHHIIKSILVSLLISLAVFYLFGLVIDSPDIAEAAGCREPSFYVNLVIFSIIYTPLSELLGIIGNLSSRKNEREADQFAYEHGVGRSESSALKKMSAKSLANLTPHPAVVFVEYSHPTLKERVEALEK